MANFALRSAALWYKSSFILREIELQLVCVAGFVLQSAE
jgi:hypothetical protein